MAYQCPACTAGLNNFTLGAMNFMRVLVTGWRYWPLAEAHRVHQKLEYIQRINPDDILVIVEGACHRGGVDQYAYEWAVGQNSPRVLSERHPATFSSDGRVQGPQRNSHMVSLGVDILLSFPESGTQQTGGTWDCTRKAKQTGCPSILTPYR